MSTRSVSILQDAFEPAGSEEENVGRSRELQERMRRGLVVEREVQQLERAATGAVERLRCPGPFHCVYVALVLRLAIHKPSLLGIRHESVGVVGVLGVAAD